MLSLESLGSSRLKFNNQSQITKTRLKQFLLFTYLAERAAPQSRKEIADLLWPGSPKKQQFGSLRFLLNRIKNEGGGDYLHISRDELDLTDRSTIDFDLQKIRTIAADLHNGSLEQLQSFFDLYKGPFLGDLNLDGYPGLADWAFAIQHEIETILCQAYLLLTPRLLAVDAADEAVNYGQIVTELAPYDDQLWAIYIKCVIAQGKIAEALKILNQYRKDVLGIDPNHQFSADLMELGARLAKPEQLARYLTESPQTRQFNDPRPYSKTNAKNFVVPHQEIIGRESESTKLTSFLDKGFRFISVVGMGGIGKTYFVRSQIPALIQRFGPDTFFIELQEIEFGDPHIIKPSESGQLLPFLCNQLDILPRASVSELEQVLNYFANRSACLILDNFESVINEADVVSSLLTKLPDLVIIATSRKQLQLKNECVLRISGLEVMGGQTPETLFGPATKLFERAAQRQQPDFQLTTENGNTVIELCKELGGLPLAIELLAKQLNLFTLQELISSSTDRAQLLQSNAIDLPPQHRSVFKLLENMWEKLSDEAKEVLPELTRFANQWGREAMQTIAPAELNVYQELLQASMLQQVKPGTFELHPLVKRFAAGQRSTDQAESLIFGFDEHDDVEGLSQTAIRSSKGLELTDQQDLNLRFDLLFALIRSRIRLMKDFLPLRPMGEDLYRLAEEIGELKKITWAAYIQGAVDEHTGNYQDGLDRLNFALKLAEQENLNNEKGYILLRIAICKRYLMQHEQALEKIKECKIHLIENPNTDLELRANYLECLIRMHLKELELSRSLTLEFMENSKRDGQNIWYCNGSNLLSQILFTMGDFDQAIEVIDEALTLCQQIGHKVIIPILKGNLGIMLTQLGVFEDALENLNVVADHFLQNGQLQFLTHVKVTIAQINFWTGRSELAEEKFAEAMGLLPKFENKLINAQVWETYGAFLVESNRFSEAIDAYSTSISLNPEKGLANTFTMVNCGLALAYCELGDHEKALQHAEKGWSEMHDNQFAGEWEWATACVHLIRVFEHAQDPRAAHLLAHANSIIQARSAKIVSPNFKDGYLKSRPGNRWLVERYAAITI